MVKRNISRYEEQDALTDMVSALRDCRKLAGYNQSDFGKLIGLSRRTIMRIEGLYESSVLSIECELLKRWYSACSARLEANDLAILYDAIQEYLFPSIYRQLNKAADKMPGIRGSANRNLLNLLNK